MRKTTLTHRLPVSLAPLQEQSFPTNCDDLDIIFGKWLKKVYMFDILIFSASFEVTVNGNLFYSKLEKGKFPDFHDVSVTMETEIVMCEWAAWLTHK